jgi:hypothetical protein
MSEKAPNKAGRDGGSVTVGLPKLKDVRRTLIAKRVAAGVDTPIGHRCSNPTEQLENYGRADNEDQRENLGKLIRRSGWTATLRQGK